jgi:hypothetical protein
MVSVVPLIAALWQTPAREKNAGSG